MSAQGDVVAGLDISSLSSVTAVQFLQMINQLAPLANIGGIVHGSSAPDVANNQRFKRYIWLDSSGGVYPTAKYYDASEPSGANAAANWTAVAVAAGSIVNASISAAAAIAVTKLAFGTARYVLRTNAAGTALEFVAPASINTTGEIPVANLVPNGSNGYLKTTSGVAAWVSDATERAAIQNALANLAVTVLAAGANNTLLGTNGSGVVEFNTIGNLLAAGAIGLNLLAQGGAAQYDILYWSGTAWEKRTPALNLFQAATINTGITVGALGGATVFTQAHGLGAVPKGLRAVVVCTTIDNGYAVGDELDVFCIRNAAANNTNIGLSADATNITFTLNSAAGNEIPNKGTGTFAAMTEASWSLKLYAWK